MSTVAQKAQRPVTGIDRDQGRIAVCALDEAICLQPRLVVVTDNLHLITLNLARSAEFPEGSSECGYEIFAPLTTDRHLDAQAWQGLRNHCSVRHFWKGQDKFGLLRHRAGGVHGATWCIDYGAVGASEIEAGFRLDTHAFQEGAYVSISDTDGDLHTFRVAKVVRARLIAAN